MQEPKVEMKNIKTFRGMEGMGLNADIYINGVKCLFLMDSADGGCYDYEENISHKDPTLVKANIKLLNDYIEQLPEQPYEIGDHKGMMKVDLDSYLDELFTKLEKAKAEKKMEKHFAYGFVFGVPDANTYNFVKYKIPLSQIPKATLQTQLNQIVLTHCKKGVKILNTNIDELGLKII